ncbi:hypothetical protein B9479_004682 [Cryptococcus floricola]|uniref:INO80 complex subunit B-like conserved region domain-containing protein n=1 Tax=Cryptococcus floricola TaxID=2591691 RepID=A0A5D3AV68_9TREE|nr:hypothetical protein B9479_004682 [Cryptococcus floricola]
MPPKTAPISSAARRSKRVVDSESPSSTGEPSASPPPAPAPAPAPRRARAPPAKAPARATRGAGAEKRVTYAEHSEDDEDGAVEEESEEDELEEEEDESMEVDEPAPVNPLRIKLTVKRQAPAASGPSGTRIKLPSRSLSPQKKAASKKRKSREETLDMEEEGYGEGEQDELEEDQLLDEEGYEDNERRHPSSSPSKMTARQRAKGNSDLQDHLLVLEEARPTRALQLTEQEKIERKEEASRRRRRQIEQRLQDEQDETINRLLRAQTSRSRAKIDDDMDPSTGNPSPSRRIQAPPEGMVRWTSKMGKEGAVVMSVAVPSGQERWLDMGAPSVEPKKDERMCNAPGCGEKRKYRSVKVFEKGGCSMAHLETN